MAAVTNRLVFLASTGEQIDSTAVIVSNPMARRMYIEEHLLKQDHLDYWASFCGTTTAVWSDGMRTIASLFAPWPPRHQRVSVSLREPCRHAPCASVISSTSWPSGRPDCTPGRERARFRAALRACLSTAPARPLCSARVSRPSRERESQDAGQHPWRITSVWRVSKGARRMPRKIRDLIADLESAGFSDRGGKGSHRNFVHPRVGRPVTICGKPGDDAKQYQERAVKRAIEESSS